MDDSDLSSTLLSSPPCSSALPSSPLSTLSKSPSLPPCSPTELDACDRYPSPSSSAAQSGTASPVKRTRLPSSAPEIHARTDGPPPSKRRRVAGPKQPRERTTEYLDLERANEPGEQEELFARLLMVLRKKKRIVVIAGAGISVSAGIPDFRSSTGLFATLRVQHKLKASGKQLFDASVYKDDSSTSSFHTMVRELANMTEKAQPTPFHHMLASLAHEGRLMRLYSQNVDCLDTGMAPLATRVPLNQKGPWPTTIQLHGGLAHMVCSMCHEIEPFDSSRFDGPEPPPCPKCEDMDNVRTSFAGKRSRGIGRLRPRIVLYNEYNPDQEAIGMVSQADLRRVPDAVVVVGTSLKIPGVRRIVKEMCQVTRSRRDGFTVWLNTDPEPQGAEFKDCWDMIVRGRCDDVAELVNMPRWDQQLVDEQEAEGGARPWAVTPDAEEAKERCHQKNPVVNIKPAASPPPPPVPSEKPEPKSRLIVHLTERATLGGIPTPSASPRLESTLPAAAKGSNAAASSKTRQGRLLFTATQATATPEGDGQKRAKKASAAPRKTRLATPTTPSRAKNVGGRVSRAKKTKDTTRPAPLGIAAAFKATKPGSGPPVKAESSSSSPLLPKHFALSDQAVSKDDKLDSLDALDQPQLPSLRPHPPSLATKQLKRRGRARARSGGLEDTGNDENAKPGSASPLRLQTPPDRDSHVPAETISPTSKPRNLSHLID